MKRNNRNRKHFILLLLLLVTAVVSWYLFKFCFLPFLFALIVVCLKVFKVYENKKVPLWKLCCAALSLSLWLALVVGMFFSETSANSVVGDTFARILKKAFGWFSYIVLFSPLFFLGWRIYKKFKRGEQVVATKKSNATNDNPMKPDVVETTNEDMPYQKSGSDTYSESHASMQYELPPIELLKEYSNGKESFIQEETENKKLLIEQALDDFGIKVSETSFTIGTSVTRYEFVLARGVSANKLKNLDEDIARYLKVESVRIIPSVKNRGTVGIEVPNESRGIVGLKGILSSDEYRVSSYELPLAVGRTIDGNPKIIDLVKMPHILVAGATGQGKSVGLNSMIVSLLYKKHPEELKFVLIDPKLVELSIYEKIRKEFLAEIPGIGYSVITNDEKQIATALQSLCKEMDNRLEMLRKVGCRDLASYKANYAANKMGKYPYIVIVIDEFADMMLKASENKGIKNSLIRLAQMSRATGIHMIIATQRPSAKVIVGEISVNFPARMAFRVSKPNDSLIALGMTGAEKLIGRGDMIFSADSDIMRLQGTYISVEEVQKIIEYIAEQKYISHSYSRLPDCL